MMKWKARKETADIGELELGNITFNEDYMEVSIDICDVSDSLKAEIGNAVELRKAESVKEWAAVYAERPELPRFDRTWSSKPPVIDYTYLRLFLRAEKQSGTALRSDFMM